MVSVEFAGDAPGVTLVGWNVPVAPVGNPLTVNVTALLNDPFSGVTVMVYVAEPPAEIVCGPVGELIVNVGAGDPVPFSVVVCGAPVALSATDSVAVRLAADAGVNVTLIVHVCCGVREAGHSFDSAKSLGFVPVRVIPVIDSAVLPVFVSVAVCAALVVPTTPVNVSVPGASVAVSTCTTVTVTVTAGDVLPASLLSPPYIAVTECAPSASVDVVNVATPAPFNVPVPSTVAPSIKVTVPVGTPLPGFCVTVAVKVTLVPTFTFAALAIRVVDVCARLTVTTTAFDVLAALFVSPPYTAVIECCPTASVVVMNVASPEPFNVPVPSIVAPSMNVTDPVGVVPPTGGVTVAVNVMLVPAVTLVALAVSTLELAAEFTITELAPVAVVYVWAPATSGV
jgi:hypothetical protein